MSVLSQKHSGYTFLSFTGTLERIDFHLNILIFVATRTVSKCSTNVNGTKLFNFERIVAETEKCFFDHPYLYWYNNISKYGTFTKDAYI